MSTTHPGRALLLLVFLTLGQARAETVVETTGEAAISRGDLPSARLEALSRARWEAVERVAGVEVKASSFVKDFVLLDESIIKRTEGVIKSSTVLSEDHTAEIYTERIRAAVSIEPARSAVAQIARNHAIAVYMPAADKRSVVKELNSFSEGVVRRLIRAGYVVVDASAGGGPVKYSQLETALAGDDYESLQPVLYRYLANTMLIGTIELTHSGRRGERDSLGPLPGDIVTARLNYRLVAADEQGVRRILASGAASDKGSGNGLEEASERALDELAASAIDLLIADVQRNVKRQTTMLRVKVDGVNSVATDRAVRDHLQSITWVSRVESERPGEYSVEYGERPIYLVTSVNRLPGFRVADFTTNSILARFEGP